MKMIDLFAGAGGASEGARQAGVDVVWAANHWHTAVAIHAANHAETEHVCQDLQQARWEDVPDCDILWASPCCQGHSRARGRDKSASDGSRSTAFAVVAAAEVKRPKLLFVENVPEFARWVLYPHWRAMLEALGYTLTVMVVNAADVGVAQDRRRLFVVGRRGRAAVPLMPPQVHESALTPAASFLDWSAGKWSDVDREGRAPSTLRRIEAGRRQFGDQFLVSYYGTTSGGRSQSRPIGTITTRDRWALVNGGMMRMLSVDEARAAMGFPAGYRLPPANKDAMMALGNAVCPPVAKWLIEETLRLEHAA
jgi:DNA (cytosine-5)-methyltransferase 1